MGIMKKYSNDDITIIWTPDLCVHAGICWGMLPQVYRPKERPWVRMENATTEELKEQVKRCPTGALSYVVNKKG